MQNRESSIRTLYPISWICKSNEFVDFISNRLSMMGSKQRVGKEMISICDFGSGENEEIPLFFGQLFSFMCENEIQFSDYQTDPFIVYCVDLHQPRLESLYYKCQEENILRSSRVVYATLETMHETAQFPLIQKEYLEAHTEVRNDIDNILLEEERFPPTSFDIGVLNNDIIGYLLEYYKHYSDAQSCLQNIRTSLHDDSILIVTQPCSLYKYDVFSILDESNFKLIEVIDIDYRVGTWNKLTDDISPDFLSKLNHYTILVLSTT